MVSSLFSRVLQRHFSSTDKVAEVRPICQELGSLIDYCGPVQLVMPMPIMIWLAVIVEAAIANWLDMIILLLIQFINASIGW